MIIIVSGFYLYFSSVFYYKENISTTSVIFTVFCDCIWILLVKGAFFHFDFNASLLWYRRDNKTTNIRFHILLAQKDFFISCWNIGKVVKCIFLLIMDNLSIKIKNVVKYVQKNTVTIYGDKNWLNILYQLDIWFARFWQSSAANYCGALHNSATRCYY